MSWRLIIVIVIFAVFLVFAAFNADNRCNIEFGFGLVIENVPVFVTIFTSFVIGLLCSLPLTMHVRHKYRKILAEKIDKNEVHTLNEIDAGSPRFQYDEVPVEPEISAADKKLKKDAAEAKKRFLSKRKTDA